MARIVKAKEIPGRKVFRSNLQSILKEFEESDFIIGKYEYEENNYVDNHSAANAVRVACKRGKFAIKVHERKGEVYLEKVRV